MPHPDHLRNFLHVVELGSLSRAAKVAHITQPALSRQMKMLEEELGCELFDRTGRGMLPTLEARRLEIRVRPLLNQFDSLHREFSHAPISGPVTMAVSPSVGMAWTAQVVQAFRRQFPLVDLRLVVTLSGSMGEAIFKGKFDLGVLHSPAAANRRLEIADLWSEEAYFVCQKTHEQAGAASVLFRNILKEPLILPSSQHGIRALLDEQARAVNQTVMVALEVDSVQLGLELVRQGAGNMVLTERALSDLAARQLIAVPIRRPTLIRTAQLVASEASLLRSPVRALWEHVVAQTVR